MGHMLDVDGSGSVSKTELLTSIRDRGGVLGVPQPLQHIFKPEAVMNLFEFLDTSNSGEVDENDFVDGVVQMAMTEVPLESHQMLKLLKVNRRKVEHIQSMLRFLILQAEEHSKTAA